MKITLMVLLLFFSFQVTAQYKDISVEKSTSPSLKLIQVDFFEESTLFYFQYDVINSQGQGACADENFFVFDKVTQKKYPLIQSINLPICENMHIFEHGNQKHNFILEFEKIPNGINDFDIIENESVGSNFYGVKINKLITDTSYMDISEFLKLTPTKEFGYYFKDGQPVFYYKHKGLIIAVLLEYEKNYGKYYKANIVVQNLTGKDILLDPSQITAKYQKKEIFTEALVLNYNNYMDRVNQSQSWSAFAKVLGESLVNINAGYTYETTYGSGTFNSNSYGTLDGSYNNMNFNISGNSNTNSTIRTTTSTKTFNSTEQKMALEKSQQNIENFFLEQQNIKRQISDGYLRLNTIFNGTEYIGYIYIEYKKNDMFQLHIPIKGTTYSFEWVW